MCAAATLSNFANEENFRLRRIQMPYLGTFYTLLEYTPCVTNLVLAILSLEEIITRNVSAGFPRRYAWILTARVYFFTMLHVIWLDIRHRSNLLLSPEADILHIFDSCSDLSSCVFPSSIANEILRISFVIHDSEVHSLTAPTIRPGLYIDHLSDHPADDQPNFEALITHDYLMIPSIRTLQNMIYLIRRRSTLLNSADIYTDAANILLTGQLTNNHVLVNHGRLTSRNLFNTLCNNPALTLALWHSPLAFTQGIDSLGEDNLFEPVTVADCDMRIDDQPHPRLEPQLRPTIFDQVRAHSGTFAAFDYSSCSYGQMDVPNSPVLREETQTHFNASGTPPRPRPIKYDSDFWLQAITS